MIIKHFPLQQQYMLGHLLKGSDKVMDGAWFDILGMVEAKLTLSGMAPGDQVEIFGANTVDVPTAEQKIPLFKPFTKSCEINIKKCRWIRAEHTEASGSPVTVDFLGSN